MTMLLWGAAAVLLVEGIVLMAAKNYMRRKIENDQRNK